MPVSKQCRHSIVGPLAFSIRRRFLQVGEECVPRVLELFNFKF